MSTLVRSPRTAGDLIRRERLTRGWSQTELAARMRVRQATVSKLEAGEPATRMEVLFKALSALGLQFIKGDRVPDQDLEDLF